MDDGFEIIGLLLKLFSLHSKGYKIEIYFRGISDAEKDGYERIMDLKLRKFADGEEATDYKEYLIYLIGTNKEDPQIAHICIGSGTELFIALKEVLKKFEEYRDELLPYYYWRKE